MMKSGRSSDPRCCVSARLLRTINTQYYDSGKGLPNLPKLVIRQLAFHEYIPCLLPRYETILRSTSDKDPGELGPVGGTQNREPADGIGRERRPTSLTGVLSG